MIKIMSVRVLILGVSLAGGGTLWGETEPRAPELRGEAFRQLEIELLQRNPGMSPENAAQLLAENFRHLYVNCVKESGFLVKPSSQRIASLTLELLRQQRELEDILVRARRSLALAADPSGGRMASLKLGLIREARQKGRKIRDIFRQNFLDSSQASFQMTMARSGDTAFLTFVMEGERINRLLNQEMERYFFGARPGVVAVRDYQRASISVLGEALTQLAKASEEKLKP